MDEVIFHVASTLQVPVLIAALLALALVLLELGAFAVELHGRRRRRFSELSLAAQRARAALLAGDRTAAGAAVHEIPKAASFRWGCNKRLRSAFATLADSTRHWHPWAQDLYASAIARGHDHPRALRTLGRAWSRVVWRCWQDRMPYDPARHRALQRHITVIIPTPSGPVPDLIATQRMAGDAISLDVGSAQGSLRAAQPSPPKQRSTGGQSRAARQGRAQRAA